MTLCFKKMLIGMTKDKL